MERKYKLISGTQSKKFKTVNECKKLYPIFAPIIESLAKCIKENSLKSGKLKFSGEGNNFSLNFLNNNGKKSEILIEITGFENNYFGVPYYSSLDGLFYRLPRHKKKPFVRNGQFVKRGSSIGIIFINKNEQFVLNAPSDGFIYFPGEDKHLDQGISIKVFEEGDSKSNIPIFYLGQTR